MRTCLLPTATLEGLILYLAQDLRRSQRGPGALPTSCLATFLLLLAWGPLAGQGTLELPPVPEDYEFLQDYGQILDTDTRIEIGMVQREALERHRTPIVVVTIRSKGEYGGAGHSIEDFARAWFDHWQIGFTGPGGELLNHGILLLVSPGDRAARIELGADWGRRWDGHAQHIMDERIVPSLSKSDYDTGILEAVWTLLDMAAMGPDSSPPGWLARSLESIAGRAFTHTPLPVAVSLLLLLVGLGLIVQAYRDPHNGKLLLFLGVTLMVGALVFWVLLALLGLIFRGRFEGKSGGGFGSAGGFGGGGFSGGGGATGRW